MAKIRHIAYRVDDPDKVARFFIEGFEMSVVQRRAKGVIDLTDGMLNITLLPASEGDQSRAKGIEHIGFTAPDNEAAKRKLLAAGAREKAQLRFSETHYEDKFEGPEGLIVDIGHWAGAAPVEDMQKETASAK